MSLFKITQSIYFAREIVKTIHIHWRFLFQVYLDIKFAFNPKITLPVVILPASVTQKDIDEANTEMGPKIKDRIMDQQAS